MCYPDQVYYITFFFRLLKGFEVSLKTSETQQSGHPKVHADGSLIVFFAIMTLKGIHRFKAQHDFLVANPKWVRRLKFKSTPHVQRYLVAINNSHRNSTHLLNLSGI